MEVVILCGGKGTRSYPFTEYFPEGHDADLRDADPGAPDAAVYAHQGFTKFVLAAGHRKEISDDYFDGRFPEWDVRSSTPATTATPASGFAVRALRGRHVFRNLRRRARQRQPASCWLAHAHGRRWQP